MRKAIWGAAIALSLLLGQPAAAQSPDLGSLLPSLRAGGYVIVMTHLMTDPGQEDVYPLDYNDTSKQRLLSDLGYEAAQALGEAFLRLGIPFGEVRSSRLFRAIETAGLICHKSVTPDDRLTDTAAPEAGGADVHEAAGAALRAIAATPPEPGTNTLVVTHAANLADAFGADWADFGDGEAALFLPDGSAEPALVRRVGPGDWVALANGLL